MEPPAIPLQGSWLDPLQVSPRPEKTANIDYQEKQGNDPKTRLPHANTSPEPASVTDECSKDIIWIQIHACENRAKNQECC